MKHWTATKTNVYISDYLITTNINVQIIPFKADKSSVLNIKCHKCKFYMARYTTPNISKTQKESGSNQTRKQSRLHMFKYLLVVDLNINVSWRLCYDYEPYLGKYWYYRSFKRLLSVFKNLENLS